MGVKRLRTVSGSAAKNCFDAGRGRVKIRGIGVGDALFATVQSVTSRRPDVQRTLPHDLCQNPAGT